MKFVEWKTYRTRFLVQAKQLNSALTFVDPLGRQHCGRKGDYLVESSDGRISIAPRQIFEDIYVPISLTEEERNEANKKREASYDSQIPNAPSNPSRMIDRRTTDRRTVDRLDITEVRLGQSPISSIASSRESRPDEPARVRRKLPQPCRDRRASPTPSRLSLM